MGIFTTTDHKRVGSIYKAETKVKPFAVAAAIGLGLLILGGLVNNSDNANKVTPVQYNQVR